MTSAEPVDVAAWPPSRFTAPLAPFFPSLYDRYRPVIEIVWRVAFGYLPEAWQSELLRAVLEVYPEGHARAGQLRYRQVIVSLGRQNGKTEVAAILGLIGLLRSASAVVIGLASTLEQANLIYKRTMEAISRNSKLADLFHVSGTRGIRRAEGGGEYRLKPAKSAALQGIPIDLGLVDELHLLKAEVWADLVNGTGGRANGIVVGITTAGNDASELLIRLYKLAAEAFSQTEAGRFGAFIWEAPSDTIPKDDDEFLTWLKHANPSLASGRRDAEATISDARSLPPTDVLRYLGNRFISGAASPFIEPTKWAARGRADGAVWPDGVRPVFSFERTPDWGFGVIVATGKNQTGRLHTEVVASMVNPTLERFLAAALKLNRHAPLTFAMDRYALGDLATELRRRGMTVRVGTQMDAINAASMLYAKVVRGQIEHAGDALLAAQMPHAIRKNIGENYRIARAGLGVEVDAVLATALGVLVAETTTDSGPQVF
jgi:hypothetical protein